MEQTFKVDQFDLTSEKELYKLVDEDFLQGALLRFEAMEQALAEALQKL